LPSEFILQDAMIVTFFTEHGNIVAGITNPPLGAEYCLHWDWSKAKLHVQISMFDAVVKPNSSNLNSYPPLPLNI